MMPSARNGERRWCAPILTQTATAITVCGGMVVLGRKQSILHGGRLVTAVQITPLDYRASSACRSSAMTLCPIALMAGCKSCPVVSMCPLKTVIGDYKPDDRSGKSDQGGGTNRDG